MPIPKKLRSTGCNTWIVAALQWGHHPFNIGTNFPAVWCSSVWLFDGTWWNLNSEAFFLNVHLYWHMGLLVRAPPPVQHSDLWTSAWVQQPIGLQYPLFRQLTSFWLPCLPLSTPLALTPHSFPHIQCLILMGWILSFQRLLDDRGLVFPRKSVSDCFFCRHAAWGGGRLGRSPSTFLLRYQIRMRCLQLKCQPSIRLPLLPCTLLFSVKAAGVCSPQGVQLGIPKNCMRLSQFNRS